MAGQFNRKIPFKVDVAGVIRIMGSSLYSRDSTPVRELIQNAHDAIMRRRSRDIGFKGRIRLAQDPVAGTLSVSDDGVGLTADEAEQYLGTLGIGITGMIRRDVPPAGHSGDPDTLIGQFGVGLFSAFLLAEKVSVETRKADRSPAVRWVAGPGTDIELSSVDREQPGTTVTLHLRPEHRRFATDEPALAAVVKEYADFLPVPIFINDGPTRVNLINATWFDPTPDREAIELELAEFFGESPLDVIPIRVDDPVSPVVGALYVTPSRTPGFSGEAVVTATVRRMVISRDIRGLLPKWAGFLRGTLELNGCAPTASREDLVRDAAFQRARAALESMLYAHLESLAARDPDRLAAMIAWHRYALAGAALDQPRLRRLLRTTYEFPTTAGTMVFDAILKSSAADPLAENDASHVIWFNGDRRQERWAEQVFTGHPAPCVHAVRTFEESLLAAMAADAMSSESADAPIRIDLRPASASSPNFAKSVLGINDLEPCPPGWESFLADSGASVFVAGFDDRTPVMAFVNERHELIKTFDTMRQTGQVPAGFQRLIDTHLRATGGKHAKPARNEILLNRRHPLIKRALAGSTAHPLASVLRLLVSQALTTAGVTVGGDARRRQSEDLQWIADVLWTRQQNKPDPA